MEGASSSRLTQSSHITSSGTYHQTITDNYYKCPDDIEGSLLGNVITIDECVSSLFGDTHLFFKHQWIEDDVALKSEWSDAYFNDCYCNAPWMTINENVEPYLPYSNIRPK